MENLHSKTNIKNDMATYITKVAPEMPHQYQLRLHEIQQFYEMIISGRIYEAIILCYKYGAAKCWQMARRRGIGKIN